MHIPFRSFLTSLATLAFLLGCAGTKEIPADQPLVSTETLSHYVSYFNAMEAEDVRNLVPNAAAEGWLEKNVPRFECPDSTLEQAYYFRWWTYRKHLKETPDGYVFTEFIQPVGHGGKHQTISCALGHQTYEGRWLHDQAYLDQFLHFWFFIDPNEPKPRFHKFSNWAADAVYERFLVDQDTAFVVSLLDSLDADYHKWVAEKGMDDGLFYQFDVRDGMEESISGSRRDKNERPTINSYMYGNAKAMTKMAHLVGREAMAEDYERRADTLKQLVQERLWDPKAHFFKARLEQGDTLADVREEIGFIPWYFGLPDDTPEYARAWEQMLDTNGFAAPWGLTTAERRHPAFRTHGTGSCEWDGAIWPFATTQTLKGLSTLLHSYKNHSMTKDDFFEALHTYAQAQQKNGRPYIGEYQDERTGYWLKGDNPRSRYYNHSGFCDLIINDLVGLRPRPDNTLEVSPLVPEGQWDWFCLDNVLYHDRIVTVLWDKTGEHYGMGKGFRLFADGQEIFHADHLTDAQAPLPEKKTGHSIAMQHR
ncbi:hypothetical protein SAMN05421823_110176 [Catalinimonas alkaloidigena]|uniref:Uncharacterized protein n=1 Tax=Catalinimonas alkaloidigena TaxID=1075417 RepID=A0A1G9QHI9_9BACT|nr:glycosyl hydrolase family 65 protein [Catalinimonas alkaloidigena]SDM10512.1 hypothetical protein SAMN05421823_110176 [Catalinimonas alkaloidigena]